MSLSKQAHDLRIDMATWPRWMRHEGDDDLLTEDEREEAARRLLARAAELWPEHRQIKVQSMLEATGWLSSGPPVQVDKQAEAECQRQKHHE